MTYDIQQPDYRNNGNYQFITGYTGGGAAMCVHLTYDEYAGRCRQKFGEGKLVEINGKFYWKTDQAPALAEQSGILYSLPCTD